MKDTKLYGLIGFPLGHTFSPTYFNAKFSRVGIDAVYQAFPLSNINELPALIAQNSNLCGLNVTTPYKEAVIPFLDELHPNAATVGAVNCIDIRNGKTIGYNTDIIGFEQSLKPLLTDDMNKALVLGTGGAAGAVKWVLNKLGISYTEVSRTAKDGAIAYETLTETDIATHRLIINSTPLGMHPLIENYPEIQYDALTDKHLLYDLIYNPAETRFLQLGAQYGAATKNGQEMLEIQADASWQIWNA